MLEIIALMKPIQLKESSVNDAIDTPKIKVTDCINGQLINIKADPILQSDLSGELALSSLRNLLHMHIHRYTHTAHIRMYVGFDKITSMYE